MQTLTEAEVSGIMKCTKAALRRWRREGRGPRFLRIGRLIRYRVSDLEEFLDKHASELVPVSSPDSRNHESAETS
jgi:Helix-turn-helix domain